jgi:hypothetical protein
MEAPRVGKARDQNGGGEVEANAREPTFAVRYGSLKIRADGVQVATAGGYGIRCVETCYKWAELPLKETIAAELVPIERELANSRTGGYLLQRCDLSGLKCASSSHPLCRLLLSELC